MDRSFSTGTMYDFQHLGMKNKQHIKVFKRTGFIQGRETVRQRSATESRRDGTTPSPLGEGWGGACAVPTGQFAVDKRLLQVFNFPFLSKTVK